MDEISLKDLRSNSVCLVGMGVSNKALLNYLLKNKVFPNIRCDKEIKLPNGTDGIFGKEHKNVKEKIVFRSPGVRLDSLGKDMRVLTESSFALSLSPSHKIGITGSDGKTTTTTLIKEILSAQKINAFACGNIGTPIISLIEKAKENDYLVCELSSFQLLDCAPALDIAVITHISENHLDFHKSFGEYLEAKANILKSSHRAVLYYDSPYRDYFKHKNKVYISLDEIEPNKYLKNDFVYIKNGYFYYNDKRLFSQKMVKLCGKHNLLNVMSAIGATYGTCNIDAICKAVSTFYGVDHRSSVVEKINGVIYIDSSADSSPARTKNTLSIFPKEKTIAILGGYDKCLSYDILSDAFLGVKCAIVFGENREKIIKAIKNSCKIILVNDIFEATNLASKVAKDGDYVVLTPASASFDMFKNYIDRSEKFKEAIRGLDNGKDKRGFNKTCK